MTKFLLAMPIGLLMATGLGCEAPVRVQPGLSAIRIRVQAHPKAGYREPVEDSYGTSEGVPNAGPFVRVDYSALDNIVVWIEPAEGAAAPPGPPPVVLSIDGERRSDRNLPLHATGVGGRLMVRNYGVQTEQVYSVSDDNLFDLGPILPGGRASCAAQSSGVIEVLSAQRDDPVAVVFVAPTPWVHRVRSGRTVTFTDLPPGQCRIECWHPRLPGASSLIELLPDEVGRARLSVGVNALPEVR